MLCVSTWWNKDSQGSTTWQLISDFCEKRLKKKPTELSPIYCTVLDDKLSEQQKEDTTRYGVSLIPATRPKWSNPAEDLPTITWLLNHANYYPGLAKLKDITHVVGLHTKTNNAASAIHECLFQQAKLHHMPSKLVALFVGNAWNKDDLGLTGFHRTLIKDFCERKAKAGEDLKAYSTVLDVKISDDQKTDAESCGVTLIPAQIKEWADPKDELPELKWLLNHEVFYPDLKELDNVQYVVGYAPKTGFAAANIQSKVFPQARLVLINHAYPETICLQAEEYGLKEFEEKMLCMASKADMLFSIGPEIHQNFQNAYRADYQGKQLSEIPHEEILPRTISCSFGKDPTKGKIEQHHILTCGQLDVQEAIERCDVMAASIGTAANQWKATHTHPPVWKILGVSQQADKKEVKFLSNKMQCPYTKPCTLQPGHSAKDLLRSLQQSHLCLPAPFYVDYSFYGLEAMVSGLPTAVYEYTHLARFIMKYFEDHTDNCVVRSPEENLSETIVKHLRNTKMAFKKANDLKTDLVHSEVISTSHARFASMLTTSVQQQTGDDVKDPGSEKDKKESLGVQIELDKDAYVKRLKELEEELKGLPADQRQNAIYKLEAVCRDCKKALKRRVEEVVADADSCEEVKKLCKNNLGDNMDPTSVTKKSLGILLRFLTLYNLYRLKQTCRSGSLARAFEPLLITDEMRKMAAEVGIKLQLKATYNQEKFNEVELFFFDRDGGGTKPLQEVKIDYDGEEAEFAKVKVTVTDEKWNLREELSMASAHKKGDWSVRLTDGYSQKTGRIFKQPRGMVFHGNRLVVCDPDNNIIRILNEDYRCDKVLGSFDGQFARPFKPWDVAVSDESHYFMNDRGNFQIVVCDEDNKILTLIDLTWDIEAHGITICLGFLVVTDVRENRLLKYTKRGKYVSEINNEELCGLSQFNRPYSVAVNSNGEIGVSDHWNHCIKHFDDELKFRDKYGERGTGDGQLWYPFGMDIDDNDDVYVCDGGNHRIVKCRSDGSWSGDLFCDVWQLRNPRYIAVQKDRIAVAELDNSNIKIFYK